MLNNFFYSHSTWATAGLVCGSLVLLGLGALWLFHRLVDWELREEHTLMTGLTYALCGGIFAVVLAFVAVGVYETMESSTAIASQEANSLGSLALDTAGLPPALGEQVRNDVYKYIDIVHQKEWPAQRAYKMEDENYAEGWAQVRKIVLDLANFNPSTPGEATVKAEMEGVTDDLFSARRTRLLAADSHLPDAVWEMLLFGLLLVAIFVFLHGPHSFKIHMVCTSLTMASIGLVFTLVIAMDYPFRGDLSVDDESFVGVKEVSMHAFERAEMPAMEVTHGGAHGKSK